MIVRPSWFITNESDETQLPRADASRMCKFQRKIAQEVACAWNSCQFVCSWISMALRSRSRTAGILSASAPLRICSTSSCRAAQRASRTSSSSAAAKRKKGKPKDSTAERR